MLAVVDERFGCQTSTLAASFLDQPTREHLAVLVGEQSPQRPGPGDPNNMQVFPVGKGGSGINLFCLPTQGNEGLNLRRLAKHLEGEMDLLIVRPANTFFRIDLFGLERDGKEAVEVIRQHQPEGAVSRVRLPFWRDGRSSNRASTFTRGPGCAADSV